MNTLSLSLFYSFSFSLRLSLSPSLSFENNRGSATNYCYMKVVNDFFFPY